MDNIKNTIDALKQIENFLDIQSSDPKKYNNAMSQIIEITSWDVRNIISRLQENVYYFGE